MCHSDSLFSQCVVIRARVEKIRVYKSIIYYHDILLNNITKFQSIIHNMKLSIRISQINEKSTEILTFLVFMKRSGIRNIENHKLFLNFLTPIYC